MVTPQEVSWVDELLADKVEMSGDESWELLELSSITVSVDDESFKEMHQLEPVKSDEENLCVENTVKETPQVNDPDVAKDEHSPEQQAEGKAKLQKEVLFIRYMLQKGLLLRGKELNDSAMERCSEVLTKLEDLGDLDLSIIRYTNIHKVLKAIRKIEFIPREEEFHFKPRSLVLLDKYLPLVQADNRKGVANLNSIDQASSTSGQPALDLAAVAPKLAALSLSEAPGDSMPGLSEPYYGSLLAKIKTLDINRFGELEGTGMSRHWNRLIRELEEFYKDKTLPYLSISPIDGMPNNCLACMEGQPDSPYAGGVFWLHITHPENYPSQPPTVRFITPIYHPNIDIYGRICLDILDEAWSPILRTETVLLSVLSVLTDPFVDNPLVPQIARQFVDDYTGYCEKARFYTLQNAKATRPDTSNLVNIMA